MSEWKIQGFWMKLLFVLASVWAVLDTLLFLWGFIGYFLGVYS